MERKAGNTAVVTNETGLLRLRKAAEEQALRLGGGASIDLHEPLPQAAEGNEDLADELLLLEMRLLSGLKNHRAMMAKMSQPVTRNISKEKIVSRLKTKAKRK